MLKNTIVITLLCISSLCIGMAPVSQQASRQTSRYASRLLNKLYPKKTYSQQRRTYSEQQPLPQGLNEAEAQNLSKLINEERALGKQTYDLYKQVTQQKEIINDASSILQKNEPTLNISHLNITSTPAKKSWYEWLTGRPSYFDKKRHAMNISRQEMTRQKAIKTYEAAVLAHKEDQKMAIAAIQKSTNKLNSLTKEKDAIWDKRLELMRQLEKYGIK